MKCFQKALCPALEEVQFNRRAIFNDNESAFFRIFFTNRGKVEAKRWHKWVARRIRYDRTHITSKVCVRADGQKITPAML